MALFSDPLVVDQLSLQDQVALRLGRMAMRIAVVESMTRNFLLAVLDVDEDEELRIEAIISELSFRKLRSALLAAVRDSSWGNAQGLQILRSLLNRMARAEERRNALTHSSWNYSALPDAMLRTKRHVSASGKIRDDIERFHDFAELDAFIGDLDVIATELSKWYIDHYLGVTRHAG